VAEHSSPFSAFASAKAKILILGPSGPLSASPMIQGRSLNLEHVSPMFLLQQEISRRTSLGQQAERMNARPANPQVAEHLHLAVLRKWFWARKPDAGFLLEGFPATLLQALVFDEWMETRGESLTAVLLSVAGSHTGSSAVLPIHSEVITYYRNLGFPCEAIPTAA